MSLGFERESASISVAGDKTGEKEGGRPAHSHGERADGPGRLGEALLGLEGDAGQ